MKILHDFFKKIVSHVFKSQHMERKLKEDEYVASEDYLVSILERFMRDDEQVLFKPFLQKIHEELNDKQGIEGWRKFMQVRDIGDASLFTAGILHSRALRSMVGLKYYTNVGESAYKILFMSLDEKDNLSLVYKKFAEDLVPFARVLSEVGHEYIFHNKLEDVIFVWERYAKYGKKEDLEWLEKQGVAFLPEFYERR